MSGGVTRARTRWRSSPGKVVNRHRSGRVTVEIVVDGRTYVVTADEVTE